MLPLETAAWSTARQPRNGTPNDPLAGQTLIASGTINYPMGGTTPFDLALRFEDDARFENDLGVEITAGGTQEVFLDLDVATWFGDQVADMLAYEEQSWEESGEDVDLPPNIVPLTGGDRVTTAGD